MSAGRAEFPIRRVSSRRVNGEDWRVELTLDDEQHGYDLGERLRSRDLDEDARARLGRRVYVSRNGSTLFLYAGSEEQARAAEEVVRQLVAEDDLSADFLGVTRWHPVEEAWKDASIPLPRTDEELQAELDAREAAERREAEEEGTYDWLVKVDLASRAETSELADRLRDEGLPVFRLWSYLEVGAVNEELANELAERLRNELPEDADVWVWANPDDLPFWTKPLPL
jgi:hypothetical protein